MSTTRSLFSRSNANRRYRRLLRAEQLENRLLLASTNHPEVDAYGPAWMERNDDSPVISVPVAQGIERASNVAMTDLGEGESSGGDLQFGAALREGGTRTDLGAAVTTDAAGNVYVIGIVEGDAVAAKYNAAGTEVWVRALEGWFGTEGADIAVDGDGNVYCTGSFIGDVNIAPAGPKLFSSPNVYSVYVLKLSSTGDFVWARRYGGNNNIHSMGIAVDGSKNVYTTGYFLGTIDFDPGTTTVNLTSNSGSPDIFVAKLNSSGNYSWAVRAGSNGDDAGHDIGLDSTGNIYVTGFFSGDADFDPGMGAVNLTNQGWEDVFLWKLSAGGNILWAKAIGGPPTENAQGMAIDSAGGVYITGYFGGDIDFDPSPEKAWPLNPAGGGDVFVAKFDSQGQFVWADGLGGNGSDQGLRIVADAYGSVFVTGTFQNTGDFNPGPDKFLLSSAGLNDIFVARLKGTSGGFVWAGRMGDNGQDQPLGNAVDGAGNVYTTGFFQATADFDPGPNRYNLMSSGDEDLFVSRLTYSLGFPKVTINQAFDQPDPTNGKEIDFTVVFTEPVFNFGSGDVQFGGTAPGTLVGTVWPGGDGSTYTVTVTGMTGSGTITASIPANVATDADANGNSGSTSTDNTVLFDAIGPTGTPADPPNGSVVGYAVLNSRHHIDIAFADTGGSGLNVNTIIDEDPEFSLTVGEHPAFDIVLDGSPTLVGGSTYRYHFTGGFGISQVDVNFLPASFYDLAGNPNQVETKGFSVTDVPVLSINDVAVTEGNSGSLNATFSVTLSYATSVPVTVAYATANDTATAGKDYTAKNGTLTFAPGVTSQTISVAVLGDQLDEVDETYLVHLSNATNAGIAKSPGVGTIIDNDTSPTLTINSVKVTEPNPPAAINAVFTVSLSKVSGREVTVDYATSNVTAFAGSDYQAVAGTLSFAPGETKKTIAVPVLGDTLDELTETFLVNLSNPGGATFAQGRGTGTITDDDPAPTVSVQDVTVNEDAGSALFTVSLSTASGQLSTVKYATSSGTAKSPGDFTSGSGVVTFPAGTVTRTISVPIIDDSVLELNETFSVKLSSAVAAKLGRKAATGTILDNEPKPTVSIGDRVSGEGAAMVFTVSLSGPSDLPATVAYTTVPGTATSGLDFKAASGTVSFPARTTTKTISISIVNDRITESNETFQVVLSNPNGADPGTMTATGTILDDDAPGITITPTAGIVTTESGGKATLNVKLNTQPTANVTLNLASSDTTEGKLSVTSVTITPSNWTTAQTVTVTGVDDSQIDGDIPYQISVTSITTTDPIYGDPKLLKPTVNAVNRDNDKLGAGKVSVTVVGDGYVVDTKGQIDTRIGKNLTTYPEDSFPFLIAKDLFGEFPSSVVWVPEVCWAGVHSCPLINSDYANGLAVTVYINTTLLATASSAAGTGDALVATDSPEISSLVQTAIQTWASAGIESTQLARLNSLDWRVVDLPGRMLGSVQGDTLLIDVDAAGHGWYLDVTPRINEEFMRISATSFCAVATSPAARRMDLLTVLTHEVGHVLGLDDLDPNSHPDDIMAAVLAPGDRRVPWTTAVDALFAQDAA